MRPRIAVVGAGFAGLAAADALVGAGIDVVVLEARDRVGGRVCSRELDNGAVVELGAEFVLPGNETVLAFADRLGLGLWDKGMRYGAREPRGGIGVDDEGMSAALAGIRSALADVATPAGISAAELLRRLAMDEGAREAIAARLEVSSATTADRVDASALLDLAAHSSDPAPSIAGGNQQIALALAARLGSALRLSSPVTAVSWREGPLRIRAGDVTVEADRAVLALPASVLGAVAFEPRLPEALQRAYAAVEYGHAAKLFVPLREPTQPSAVLSVPERYWTWTATGSRAAVQPVVNAFAGSAPALARLGTAEGADTWLESVARLRPDLAVDRHGALLSTWDDDPWARAAYSCATPPVEGWAAAGPFHACGEHTAGDRASLMEGALASGLRVAEEVLTLLATQADRGAHG